MGKVTDIRGRTFGRLKVLELHHVRKQAFWLCTCTCGGSAVVAGNELRSGHTASCGCLHRERFKYFRHGKARTRVYMTWYRMHRRCSNERSYDYRLYGARGIKVDPRWGTFEAFYRDMGDPPPSASLDRVDNEGGYGPDNCRWATAEQQGNNRRGVPLHNYAGALRSVAQIARLCGVPYTTLRKRLRTGWSFERATSTPVRHAERRSL